MADVNQKQTFAIVAACAALIGSFLDWATVQTVFGGVSFGGMEGDGVLTAGCAGLAILLYAVARNSRRAFGGVVLSIIGLAIAAWNFRNVSSNVDDISNDYAKASVGIGLYVCVIGFAVSIGLGLTWRSSLRAVEVASAQHAKLPPPTLPAEPQIEQ